MRLEAFVAEGDGQHSYCRQRVRRELLGSSYQVVAHRSAQCNCEYLGVPLFYQDQVIGALIVLHDDGSTWIPSERTSLECLALHLAYQIKRYEVRDAAQRKLGRDIMMIGISKALEKIDHRIEKVAMWDEIALIQGEIGTGKELVAHAIHLLSARQGQPLITVNCAALPRELAESSLFGHVKGAFTGATHDRKGCFEEADGGTIFLDEIGELDLKIQAKLLRVVETGELQKVGESSPRERVDVRILAATSRDLKQMAREGTFNEALLSRLDALRIQLPPLRERREDIPHLVTYFLRKFASTTLSIRCNLLIFRDCISGYNRLGHSLIRCNLLKNNTLVGCSDPNASMPPAEIDKVVLGVNRH